MILCDIEPILKMISFFIAGGCCSPKPGSAICPTDKPNHESNEVYEQWRMRCDTDDCNIENPM